MSERRRSILSKRDQATSAFSAILMRLIDSTGAVAGVLVDREGEAVDYAGALDPFTIKVTAAELRLALQLIEAEQASESPQITEMTIRAKDRSFALFALTDGYVLILELVRRSFGVSFRAINEAVHELREEAGLDYVDRRPDTERWLRVEVRTAPGDGRRPEAVWVEGAWNDVEILGHYLLDKREVGYRARLGTGAEMTLVRERLGRWWTDALPTA